MDYTQLFALKEELSLIALMVVLFAYDLIAGPGGRRWFHPVACGLLLVHTLINIMPSAEASVFGGMYEYLPVHTIIKSILNIGTLLVFLQASSWLDRPDTEYKRGEFYTLTLSTLFGMYLMISSGHFLLFFIGLETASIPMACLVAFDKYKNNSAEAGAKYILSAIFSSGLLLYGLSLIYGTTGTLYFADIPAALNGSPLQIMAFILFFVGMGFKLSLVPFHLWTADVYQGAITPVTSYLSSVSKASAAFVLMAILIKVFAPIMAQWQAVLYGIIIVTITVANLFALRQRNLKRLLAFSSISQAGYIMLGVISGDAAGMTALIYYLLVYLASNLGAFGIISVIEQKTGNVQMDGYNGLYKSNPKLAVLMMLCLFSLAGIPPFAGFFSKFFVFMTAAGAGFYALVFIALVNTVISLYYYLRIIKAMFIKENENPLPTINSDAYARVGLVVCLAGVLVLGIISAVYENIGEFTFGV